jgi:hypothetical protein
MTTYTLAQLRNRTLQKLGVLAGSETADADDAALVEQAANNLHAMLEKEVWLSWTTSAIPDTIFEPLATVTAALVCGEFGVSDSRRNELLVLADVGMGQIRVQAQAEHGDAPIKVEFY